MRVPRVPGLAPACVVLAAAVSSVFLFTHAPTARAACGGASEAPCPTPTPVNAFLTLDPTSGDGNTVINVIGGQFLPNEQVSLYWDQTNHVAGSATADNNGNINTRVKPFAGDGAGVHHLCASVQPNPCANFTLQGPATTPSTSPSATPAESPSATPTVGTNESPTSTPAAATLNGFDVISKPPFVFLPIAGAAAIALAFAFWLFSVVRRPRQVTFPSAAVVHRAMRPDYSAGFGSPPPAAATQPQPSAWDEPVAHAPAPPPPAPGSEPPTPESDISSVEWGPSVEWGSGSHDWGIPEPPLVDDSPDAPEPRD